MITASMNTWRRGRSSLSIDQPQRRVVADRRGDDQRVRALVGRDAHFALEHAAGVAGAPACPAAFGACARPSICVERRGELLGDRVLQRQHVDACRVSVALRVEALQELEHPQVRVLGADDDERVRASSATTRVRPEPAVAAPGGCPARPGAPPISKSSLRRLAMSAAEPWCTGSIHMLLTGAADVDLLDDADHAPDLRRRCR